MKQLSPALERLIAAAVLCAAFVVMASIFVPARSPASNPIAAPDDSIAASGGTASTDPHTGLISFGQIEDGCYIVQIYATDSGPRYSVYDTIDGSELAVLMTAQQVTSYFPDLPLEDLDFSAGSQLMRADDGWDGGSPR